MSKLYCFQAGSFVQAKYHADTIGLKRHEWRYITSPRDLQGLRYENCKFLKVGHWYKNKHVQEIESYIYSMKARIYKPVVENKPTPQDFFIYITFPFFMGYFATLGIGGILWILTNYS